MQLRKICGFSGVAFSPEGSWRGVASDTGMTSHREGRYGIPFRKTRVLLLRFGRRPTAADATSRNALSREKANPAGPQPCRICKIPKIIFPLKMPRATRRAFQIVSLAVTVTSSAASRRRRRHPPGTRRRRSRSCRRPTARPAGGRWGTWPARADGALPPPRPHGCCRTR